MSSGQTRLARLPSSRPPGLSLSTLSRAWWRVDETPPTQWSWTPFPNPRHRFDSAAGLHRVRYAASDPRAAMRERYAAVDRRIPPEDGHHRLISVEGELRLLDLRDESTLDALRIDDEANVGRSDEVLATTQRLSDLAVAWWGEQVHGVAYRSRTTPSAAGNIAFFASAPTRLVDHGELIAQTDLLTELIVHDQFSVAFDL